MVAAVLALAALATACGGGGSNGGDAAAPVATTAAAGATTVPVATSGGGTTVAATNLSLRITDLHLANSEESDNAVRILLPAGVTTASVTITGLPSPNQVISVCQANDLDRRLPTAACRTPAPGDSTTVTLGGGATGVEIAQVGANGSGPAANTTNLSDVTIRYAASSRSFSARLPQIESGDVGARPTFALTPPGPGGSYSATLNWTVIQAFGGTPSNAQVELLQGGNTVNKAAGGGLEVRLTGDVPAPVGDVALRVQNVGSAALVNVKLAALLP
jgi:hypothetical protein